MKLQDFAEPSLLFTFLVRLHNEAEKARRSEREAEWVWWIHKGAEEGAEGAEKGAKSFPKANWSKVGR